MKTPKGFKRALAGVLAVLTLAGYVPANTPRLLKEGIGIVAQAADSLESGGCVVTLDADGTLTVSKKAGGDGVMADYAIWDDIVSEWYDQRNDIKKVVVEEGVTKIGKYAFCYCESLTSIDLPEGLETIGAQAFVGCSNLTSLTFPDGLQTIGASAFESCGDLQTVDLPEGLESIGDYAFNECDINSLVLHDGLKYIGEYAFAQNNLQSLELPAGLETIGNHAFENCRYLFSVTFSEGLQTVGDHAFEGCNELKSAAFSEGLKTLGHDAFKNCSELESVIFSGGPERIENNAFEGCNELKSVTFSDGLKKTGYATFAYCNSLESADLPEGLETIDDDAFYCCNELKRVVIPSTVTSLSGAFGCCFKLNDVYCYADADTLTWNEDKDDFIGNKETVFHVKASQLEAFQQMYPDSRNTFAGDLPDQISLSDAVVTIKPDTAEVESVKVGDYTLIPGTDYTVKYLHGDTELEAAPEIIGAYTAVICGQGAWIDTSKEVPFTIEKKENVQYSFDFADQEQLNDWTFIDLDGDGKNWYRTSRDDCIGMNGETGVLASASYLVNPLTPDNWAIMPAGTVWNTDKPEMTFWAKAQDYNYPNEYFAVYAIPEKEADFEHFDTSKWTMVMEKTKSNIDFTEYKVDLSAFKGQRIYVAIRHYDVTDQFILKVDEVKLPMGDYKDQTSIDGATVTTPGYSADVTVSLNGRTLAPGDYYLLYKQDNTLLDEPPTEPGSYFAVIVGISGYKGVIEHPFTIRDDFAEAELSLIYNTADIDAFTVGGKKLTASKDYAVTYMKGDTVLYNAPTAVGEYTIVITGKGDYVGIFRKEFKILSAIDAFNGDPSQNPTVTLTEDDYMVCVLRNDGTVDLNGHTFKCLWLLNEDPQKTVTVKNGTIGWENSWVNMNNCPPALGMIVLENITIPSFSAAARSVTVKSGSYGTFENLAYQNLPVGYTPVIRIEGGEFGKLNLTEGAGTYEICGGIFDEKPDEAYLADGYAFYETTDGKWECISIEQHTANSVKAQIEALPNTITAADKDTIEAARTAYSALNDAQIALVGSETLAKLTAAETLLSFAISNQPQDCTGIISEVASFAVEAVNDVSYQWQFKSTLGWKDSGMTGAKTNKLSVPVTAERDGQQYRCAVTLNGKTAYSQAAAIHVKPAITSQPTTQELEIGKTAKFTVAASGTNLSYQWQFLSTSGWQNSGMTGAQTATLSVPVTAARDGQQYRCVVSNSAGSINSNVVSISVKHIAPSAVFNPTTGVLTLSGNVTADEVIEIFLEYGDEITSIVASEGTFLPANCSNLFADFSKVTTIDLSKADTGSVTDISGMFSGCSALKTIYVSNLWSLNSITSDTNMFSGCTSLVGGNGTVFDPAYTSSIRARIDGKGGKPGYFTEKGFAVLTKKECQAVTDSAAPAVSVGFSAEILQGWELEDYGIIYYNSGNVIHTEHLTLNNVGVCGIQKISDWNANIADLGYGVTAVGFVTAKNTAGTVRTMYTGELGGKYAELKPVKLTRMDNKAVASNGANKVFVGFSAELPEGSTLEDYGLIYYNSGNVIHTEHLTLGNVGVCGIKKAKYWSANITDNGYGVVCVGFVTVTDKKGNTTTYYTEELGNGVNAMAEVAKNVKLTKRANKAVTANGKNKVYVGFDATLPTGYSVEDYGLIYYNSGNVIHTEHLTLDNIGVCGIQKAKYWGANITDNGFGVVCVGFVKVKAPNGYVTTVYTGELGSSFTAVSEAAAANAVTLTKQANKAVSSNGKNKVYCGFTANTANGYTVEDYGLIYYNSGNVIHTEHLTLENVGVCGIQKAKYWGANITDNGYGVVCVGFVKVKDANGYVTTLYTEELGAKYEDLAK